MKHILIMVPGYLPGFKSGGPIRTVSNMVESLGDEVSFSVVCLDRDLGDKEPYSSIDKTDWNQQGKAKVFYIEPGLRGTLKLTSILRKVKFDSIHLNSFLSFKFSILPLLILKILRINTPVILGPRGEFSQGALAFNAKRKQLFIRFIKLIKLYRGVIWHASSTYEREDIIRVIGESASTKIAIDIADSKLNILIPKRDIAQPLRIAFISRISPKKNLDYALKIISDLKEPIVFDVYGPIEDEAYWKSSLQIANNLPINIKFNYLGSLQPEAVTQTLANYDLFFFPTRGENFGHVIAEALFAGLPVLISDQTPWRQLSEKGIGWDISLIDRKSFPSAIQECFNYSSDEYHAWRTHIRSWALENIGNQEAINATRQLFEIK